MRIQPAATVNEITGSIRYVLDRIKNSTTLNRHPISLDKGNNNASLVVFEEWKRDSILH